MGEEVANIKELYTKLKIKAQSRAESYSMIDILVRLRYGIKSPHARNILSLYWWHLFLNDKPKYEGLKLASDEAAMRQLFGDSIMTTHVAGERAITVCSDMFPEDFFEIIDAYIAYTDELSHS